MDSIIIGQAIIWGRGYRGGGKLIPHPLRELLQLVAYTGLEEQLLSNSNRVYIVLSSKPSQNSYRGI